VGNPTFSRYDRIWWDRTGAGLDVAGLSDSTVQPGTPFVIDDNRTIWVSPPLTPQIGTVDSSPMIQAALTAAKARGTATNPVTVRFMPGLYTVNTGLSLTSAVGVNLEGAGFEHTVIRFASSVYTTGVLSTLLDLSGSTNICLRGIWLDALTGANASTVGTASSTAALLDNTDDVRFDSMKCTAITYSVWAQTNTAGNLIEVFNSRFVGTNGIRTASETWHIFSSDLRGERSDTTQFAGNAVPVFALQTNGPIQIWGSHLHAEDTSTTSTGVCCVSVGSGHSVEVVGTTLHAVVSGDFDASSRICLIARINSTAAAASLTLAGNNLLIEAGSITQKTGTVGVLQLASTNNSQVHYITGNSLKETLGTGHKRGNIIHSAGSGSPTIKWTGNISSAGGWTRAGANAIAVGSFTTVEPGRQAGGATLAAGVARILLITDGGNTSEVAASFSNVSTSVTGGVSFDTIFKPGDFVRLSTDTDSAWTRIRAVSATTLSLEENYRGSTAVGTAKLGTQTINTQPDSSYRVAVTSTNVANETFSVTLKHPSGFLITSSNGASTTTADWVILR